MTVNGKVDYTALPQPDLNSVVSESDYVAPSNELEERLETIWKKVLGLEKVGIQANFFELGGDSILIIQVIARATELGITLSVRDVFEHQTIAQLAKVSRTGVTNTAEQEAGDRRGSLDADSALVSRPEFRRTVALQPRDDAARAAGGAPCRGA